MNKSAIDQLHLAPRSSEELREVLNQFENKWQHKADKLNGDVGRL